MENLLKKINKPRFIIRSDSSEQNYQDILFRNWRYTILQIKLDVAVKPISIYINSGTGILLIDRQFILS